MSVADELKSTLISHGASLIGYADLSSFRTDMRAGMPAGVSIAVALDPKIIVRISDGPTREYNEEYKRANRLLATLGNMAAETLEHSGYNARALAPTDEGLDLDTLDRLLPHKTAATRSGLGWIGKCALLVTKEYGSAIRLTTVFTDANLPTGEPINESGCGDCSECVEHCPCDALSGQNWRISSAHDPIHGFMSNYNHFACRTTANELSEKRMGIMATICGICIVACPFTQKYIRSAK